MKRPTPASLEGRLAAIVALAAAPGVAIAVAVALDTGAPRWWAAAAAAAVWGGAAAYYLRRRLGYTLNTLVNLLGALREGDFTLRAHTGWAAGPAATVFAEVNALGDLLRSQRLGAEEATRLLRRVLDSLDAAVFAFDGEARLALVNRAGAALLGQSSGRLIGLPAEELDLEELLTGEPQRLADRAFPGRAGRWDVRRSGFRKDGLPVTLLVLTDLSRPLREEERQAWKRLIRVLGHELNNSLAPIKSLAETLGNLLDRQPRPDDWEDDARRGLTLIADRSAGLSRFLAAYARLARLPRPRLRPTPVAPVVRRAAALESRLDVTVEPGPEVTVRADPDQLEQALINLVANAADAALETGGGVTIGWQVTPVGPAGGGGRGAGVELWVDDDGPGLSNPENLFVPFYTTKPAGTGIGLVLARQVAEGHGGTVTLENRPEGGCRARLRLAGAS